MFDPNLSFDRFLSKIADNTEIAHQYSKNAYDVMLGALETDMGNTPYDIVYEEDRIKLKHYKPLSTNQTKLKVPLLIIYALINRETMLDLQPERSVVKSFLDSGVDLYMVEWGYPSRKDKFLTIDDHVNGYINNLVDFIRKKHDIEQINLMGICMGGTFSTIYSSFYPEKVKNLVTTVTPTNFNTDQGLLHVWMRDIDADKLVDTYGNIPGDFMNIGFLLLNPARLIIDKYKGFRENMDNKKFVENFIRMERWIFDSPDVPGETFRQFIKDCYQENLLIQSKMYVGGRRVDLKNITMPLLNIYGKLDHLVPPEAAELLISKVGSKDTENVCLNTGHIGIYVSSRFQREFAPRIVKWLKARDDENEVKKKEPSAMMDDLPDLSLLKASIA